MSHSSRLLPTRISFLLGVTSALLVLSGCLPEKTDAERASHGSGDETPGYAGGSGEPASGEPGLGGAPAEGAGSGGRQGSGAEPSTGGGPSLQEYLPCDVEIIFRNHCRKCHSAEGLGQEPLYETYAQVKAEGAYAVEVTADDSMPKVGRTLSAEQKETLRSWVEAGAPAVRAASAPACP